MFTGNLLFLQLIFQLIQKIQCLPWGELIGVEFGQLGQYGVRHIFRLGGRVENHIGLGGRA